jgi:hypothetical protein
MRCSRFTRVRYAVGFGGSLQVGFVRRAVGRLSPLTFIATGSGALAFARLLAAQHTSGLDLRLTANKFDAIYGQSKTADKSLPTNITRTDLDITVRPPWFSE